MFDPLSRRNHRGVIVGACQQSSTEATTPAGPSAAAVQAGAVTSGVTAVVNAASRQAAKGERPCKADVDVDSRRASSGRATRRHGLYAACSAGAAR